MVRKFIGTMMIFLVLSAITLNTYAALEVDSKDPQKINIDLKDGYYKDGYYYLPVADETVDLYYVGLYKIGYIVPGKGKNGSDLFMEFGKRMIFDSNIYTGMIKIEYQPNAIMFNGTFVYSDIDYAHKDNYIVPVMYDGKKIQLTIQCSGDGVKYEIKDAKDENRNSVNLSKGDTIIPIYEYRDTGDLTYMGIDKFIGQYEQLGQFIYDESLDISVAKYNETNYAIKIEVISKDDKLVVSKPIMLMEEIKDEFIEKHLFSESQPSSWAREDIKKAYECNLTTEKVINNYQQFISREELCEMTINLYEKLSGNEAKAAFPNPFTDTDNPQILKAYQLGIVNGTGKGLFEPNNNITREQLAVMLYNTINKIFPEYGSVTYELSYNDSHQISNWAVNAIKFMSQYEFMNGNNNMFLPKDNTTKEQAIIVVNRMYEFFTKNN